MAKKYYLLMPDSSKAMQIYKEIKSVGVKCTLAPTPREADSCCGVCILYYNEEDKSKIEETITKTKIEINKFWECENQDNPNRNRFC